MLILKRQKLTLAILVMAGFGYFYFMSNLEINYFVKSLIAVMPLQIGAVIYITNLHWRRR
ncbi:MAG: hypothetical protein KME23_11310 [Goleter apudmare HA4340-LM2]|jgi:hypothetical protein|nr:hypothetical protein [Goleter apudmare HA4340-LM2]